MRLPLIRAAFVLAILIGLCVPAGFGQVQTGTPPFNSFGGGPDIINLGNLNVHLTIPVIHKAGRGINFFYDITYDSSGWTLGSSGGAATWLPAQQFWGFAGTTGLRTGYLSSVNVVVRTCKNKSGGITGYQFQQSNWVYIDAFGTPHPFVGVLSYNTGGCGTAYGGFTNSLSGGYSLTVTQPGIHILYSPEGASLNPPYGPPQTDPAGGGAITDRNGNEITSSGSSFYDTLNGTTPVVVVAGSGTPTSPKTITYTAPSGASASYTVQFATYTVETNYGCPNIGEYGSNGTTTANLVSEIDLPDIAVNPSDKYTFQYEPTPGFSGKITGRLAKVTMPTGGSISYSYTGGSNGINCSDGSAAGLTRVLSDGASWSATWTYSRTPGSLLASTTTIVDPASNSTVINFWGTYELQRAVYQGSVSTANLLETITTCYNGNTSNCATATAITYPITQRNITTLLSGGLQSEHDDFWNNFQAPTETDDYDYGSAPHGALLKKVLASYAVLGNINAFRQTVSVQNGQGTTVSEVNYNYDQTTPVTTSGTLQHVSVPAPWGNLTSTNTYTSSGSYLTKSSTYYDTGNVYQTTDINGGVTTYNYASGAASCYNSFVTSTTEAISTLSTSQTWNCTGAVKTSFTDENNAPTTITYANDKYFWRPDSTTDPTSAVTTFCYGSVSTTGTCTINPTQSESTLTFNSGNSAVDSLMTVDGLGRPILQQNRQAPGSANFDTVETTYDAVGRTYCVTLPYQSTAGQIGSPVASTCTLYDATSRPTSVTDAGGGITSYFYGNPGSQNNDVYVTRNPAPTWDNENTKRRQFEYDGLGRLSSVCEVTAGTSAWPGQTCGQNTTQTGYWTRYKYDPIGNLLGVCQFTTQPLSTDCTQTPSSGQQTRNFVFDWMSRITSETVPEIGANGNGTALYVYDSDSTCGSSAGDLVKMVDPAADVICSSYDSLHRKLTTTYPSGTYASVTPQKNFSYDSATVDGQSMANPKARLVEAYTCFSPCTTKLTDIGLSYTSRGETSDVYESTPNSGPYYHVSQSYWANQLPNQLGNNISGLPTFTYTPDGEGRVSQVTASAGQSPIVTSTLYNPASLPTTINIGSGSGDADTYQWDRNTNRMTQYQFTVNGTSLTGALGWNANATLQTQNITDGFNSADTQNCSYGYDDMTRVVSANCGSAASQTFSFDPFGNIDKAGSPGSFSPTYSTSTNRISSLPDNITPTYDSNGNLTGDSVHSYSWDADGHAIGVDNVSLTYDALGRMVEQNRSSAYTQIAYSPVGTKLALMNGQTLQKAIVPLSGKVLAVYNSSGLLYYAHADLLGSIRLATTSSRGMQFDTAYAPFGEPYASIGTLDPAYTGQMDDTAHREDTSTGIYDFPVREYSVQGRWPSPDPLGRGATCPKDPQTQNRYAYVRGNPVTFTDPTGADGGGGCDPEDPSCDPCFSDPWLCFPLPPIGIGGGGGSEQPRTFPWLLLPPRFFDSLDNSGGSTGSSNTWDRCRKNVFVPCMNAAQEQYNHCMHLQAGWCGLLVGSCAVLCADPYTAALCVACLQAATAKCVGGRLKCEREFDTLTSVCLSKLITCASAP